MHALQPSYAIERLAGFFSTHCVVETAANNSQSESPGLHPSLMQTPMVRDNAKGQGLTDSSTHKECY